MCGAMLTLPLHALPFPLPFTVLVLYTLLRVKKTRYNVLHTADT